MKALGINVERKVRDNKISLEDGSDLMESMMRVDASGGLEAFLIDKAYGDLSESEEFRSLSMDEQGELAVEMATIVMEAKDEPTRVVGIS